MLKMFQGNSYTSGNVGVNPYIVSRLLKYTLPLFLHKTNSFSIIVIVIITLQEMQLLSYSQTLITRLMAEPNYFLLKKRFF